MESSIETIDDINFILRGSIQSSKIEQEVNTLKKVLKQSEEKKSDEQIEQEAASAVFKSFIQEGVEKEGIDVNSLLGQPSLKRYEKGDEIVEIEVELATSPSIDSSVDYKALMPAFSMPEVSSEEVEKRLQEFAYSQAPQESIETPRPLMANDFAIIDFIGYIDGEAFEGGEAKKFSVQIGSHALIGDFEEQLIGMNINDDREVHVTFPENYSAQDLASKEAKFAVKLLDIQVKQPIAIDDEYAKRILNEKSATLTTLKEKFKEQLTSQKLSEHYANDLKGVIIDNILKAYTFSLPNNIIEQEIDAKVGELMHQLSKQEREKRLADKEGFVALRESLRETAKNTVKLSLIVEELAKKEGVDADEQEVIAALTYQAMTTGQNAQELVAYYQNNNLMGVAKMKLVEDKLFGHLLGFNHSL